ncbi:MAG TPA: hypothetical protein VHS96_09035 [Bacteroidia bacterium]|nr:hypothetical protein [Bacteroidia bacterium]
MELLMKLNADWHRQHPMPLHANLDQRIAWHLAHVQACACRQIPAKLMAEMKQRRIAIPEGPDTGNPDQELDLARLEAKSPKVKYAFAKELLQISMRSPARLYPHFHRWQQLLTGENQILQWTAIDIIGRMAAVDKAGKVDAEIPQLFQLLHGGHLITTAHAIFALGEIAREKPLLKSLILGELLRVPHDKFDSQECREIAIGKVVDVLGQFIPEIKDSPEAMTLIQSACHATRKATVKKGEKLRQQMAKIL